MPTTYYGIDVSKDLLHIAHQVDCDAKGQPEFGYQKLPNDLASIEQWARQLPVGSQVVFEHTARRTVGTYSARLAWVLASLNQSFSILTPGQSKGFTATLKSISKTDRSDALMLVRYGQGLQPPLTVLADETLHQLRQRHKHLNDLKVSHQSLTNQLHALGYDPRADQEVQDSLRLLSKSYQAQIALFENDLNQMSQQELQLISERMQRVKGIGPASAQALCTATNGLRGFNSAKAVVKFVGVAPTQAQSGSSVHRRGRMARTGVGYVRGMLYMAARSARKHNVGCKALYDRLRAKGRCHKVAMVAVINKLLHQIFVIVKQDIEFVNGFGLAKESLV